MHYALHGPTPTGLDLEPWSGIGVVLKGTEGNFSGISLLGGRNDGGRNGWTASADISERADLPGEQISPTVGLKSGELSAAEGIARFQDQICRN